jgi:phosphonate transport system permease protein
VRQAFSANWGGRIALIGLAAYTIYAASHLGFSWDRFVTGIDNGATFLARMFPPSVERLELLRDGMIESLQIAILASFFGVLLSLPIGLLAARNLMPPWVTWPARGVIALCRSFHPIIIAILFVKAVGFGALAGVLALIVGSIGFVGKLFAEAIEEISLKQVEAVRATGAPFLNVLIMAVQPQVLPRFIGFATYQLDSNLRNSTMVGIVGGGGIGATLFTAYQRFDFDFVLTILIVTIAMIMVAEVLSGWIRKTFQ